MAQGVYFRDFGDRHWRGPAPTPPPMISVLLEQEHRDFSKRFILSTDVLRRCCAPKSLVELRSAILPLSISRNQIKDIAVVGVNSKDCDPASDNIFGLRSVGLRQLRPPQRARKNEPCTMA